MPSRILPPSTRTAGVVAGRREPLVPSAWPGVEVPNFSDWRGGDIVLVHGTPDAIGLGIQASQLASFSPVTRAGAICSHAAIYIGDGMVVDAAPGPGVSSRSVWSYCQARAIQVRRLADPGIPASDLSDIAVEARRHIGKPYSLIETIVSKLVPGTVPTPNALYCSTFIGLVVANATGYDLSFHPLHQPLHPGTLAAHPDLTDVLLEWRLL